MRKHTPECVAQNANTLFGDSSPCICPPKPKGRPPNPCHGATLTPCDIPTEHWAVTLPFKPSTVQLKAYAASQGHAIPKVRDGAASEDADPQTITYRETFDDEALRALRHKYPKDALYPRVEGYRTLQKALGTYLTKMLPTSPLLGPDGRLHDAFRHTPRTLRLAMELLQVLPRPLSGADAARLPPDAPARAYEEIRKCLVPAPGHEFVKADFSGIEPILVAYQMRDTQFLKAALGSAHSWFTSHVIGQPVDLSMSQADIAAYYADLSRHTYTVDGTTRAWSDIRQACKTAIMTSLYAGGPGEISRANPHIFPTTKQARRYQDTLFEICPLQQWHWAVAETIERQDYLLMPTGFRLYAFEVFTYRFSPAEGRWVKRLNRNAKEIIAAGPQHLGMMYLATAVLALAEECPELAEYLRLLIHDEAFAEVPAAAVEPFIAALVERMERPHPLMPLWPEAEALTGMSHLSVKVEWKRSAASWGEM